MSYENYLNKRLLTEAEDKSTVQIFYANLDLGTRKKILDAIDASNEYLNVFTDDVVKNKIEEAFKNKPLFVIRGNEIINLMNIDI
jgi:hypothetical protein